MQRLLKIGRKFSKMTMCVSILVMFFSLSLSAMAQDNTYRLLVKMKNNEEKAFLLAKKPVVSFTDTECVIESEEFTGYFEMGEILDITFNEPSGINEKPTDTITLDYTNPEIVVLSGITPGESVTLHTVNGATYETVRADSDGKATLNMSAVAPGTVCIISVNSNKNFKILKK